MVSVAAAVSPVSADTNGAAKAGLQAADASAEALVQQPWIQQLVADNSGSKCVLQADGLAAGPWQKLSTGLQDDHLFRSLLENELLRDMLVLYAGQRKPITVMHLGDPVCGHPTVVHGGLISTVFDQTYGVLTYAAGRWGDLDAASAKAFTARLEVDYKQPLPAGSTIKCEAVVESMERNKIWLGAKLTDPTGETVYAASRALFVKPKQPAS